ncbi:MAG: HEAT repeat domain-containing protein [Alphaproteobacteria bacterium]|nr:HEAT repeat domain-containing protein [Alphaproteobacteria bacterium]
MDEQLLETWEKVASGDIEDIDVSRIQRKLIYVCFEKAGDPDPEERLKSLKVAAQFTVDDRMRLVDPLIRDRDPRVRRYAFNLAVEAHLDGLTALKTCVGGDDEDLATEALGLLITQVDITSSLHARQWLLSDFPRVRAGAAMLLGNIAGPAMSVRLGRMAQNDPVFAVREIAAEAARRCSGDLPKATPRDFWVAGPTPLDLADPPPKAAPTPVPAPPKRLVPPAPVVPPPPVLRDESRLPTIYPEGADADDDPVPPPPSRAMVPSAPAGTPEDVREPRDWREPAPLPSGLPSDPGALVKLMGRVAPSDRASVQSAFQSLSDGERSTVLRRWAPGGDAALGRGTALMIAALDDKRSASMLRHMLTDPDAGVRAGAAEAVGRVGALSMIPPLSLVLNDADPDVRAAAVRGLADLLRRTERFAMLRERIGPMQNDADARVQAAASEALASIA